MKIIFYFLFPLSAVLAQVETFAQTTIWTNPIEGTNPGGSSPYHTGESFDQNITVSGIGYGSGVTAGAATNNRYNTASWLVGATVPVSDEYFYFRLTPEPSYKINFSKFNFTIQRTASGTTDFVLRSSIDGFVTSTDIGVSETITSATPDSSSYSFDLSQFQNITQSIEFRIYAYGASAGGRVSINKFEFTGSVIEDLVLPVTFGNLQATRSNGNLDIAWTTVTETNNSHFDIEASKDGTTFEKIATVSSKAVNGISNTPLDYQFSIPVNQITGFAIPAVFALLAMGFKNRRKKVFVSLLLISVIIAACTKKDLQSVNTSKDNLFVRITQVDIDGGKTASKIMKVVENN
jgi:hypothetical protein